MKIHALIHTHLQFRGCRYTIKVQCYTCGHTADLNPAKLIERYGNISMDELRQRMKCRCGSKRNVVWADSEPPPESRTPPA